MDNDPVDISSNHPTEKYIQARERGGGGGKEKRIRTEKKGNIARTKRVSERGAVKEKETSR